MTSPPTLPTRGVLVETLAELRLRMGHGFPGLGVRGPIGGEDGEIPPAQGEAVFGEPIPPGHIGEPAGGGRSWLEGPVSQVQARGENGSLRRVFERFEAGLQDYAGIIGLGAAIQYLQGVGFDAIQKQERLLNETITAEIAKIPGLRLIGPQDASLRGGIIAFYLENVDSHRVALMLDQMDAIMVRSCQHCVHSWFNAHQIKGSVRASLYFYNTEEEAARFIDNLNKIRKVL